MGCREVGLPWEWLLCERRCGPSAGALWQHLPALHGGRSMSRAATLMLRTPVCERPLRQAVSGAWGLQKKLAARRLVATLALLRAACVFLAVLSRSRVERRNMMWHNHDRILDNLDMM
jgi:hypothetical protein